MDYYMSRLNQQNSINYGNKETHIFTEFGTFNKETTQLQVLEAIKNINLNVGEIVVGDITVESSDTVTHTKLETLNTTITSKHLSSASDSVAVSGTVAISNDIIVVDTIEGSLTDAPYDLLINGPTLWADSTPLTNPFFADPNGREGWYYDNFSNIANKSNIYWYANPVSGNLQENDMTFAQLSGMYCIITSDYVENGALTNPIMAVYSQPTGTNDYIPSFAHSRWSYSLTNINVAKLRKAETIMLYTGSTRPQVHLNIPAYPLVLASTNGDALSSEIVAYMTVNTQATTSKIGYLLQYTGFLNSAIGFNREFQFKNSKERVIQNNQYSGSVNVSNTSLAVTGAFYPATQPISGSVSANISNASLPVTGDFYPATQPISGSVSATISNASLPVTGDFYPATQPISGSVSATISNASLPVTGDFYPATQPISGSVSISGTPTVSATISNTSLAVTGAFYPATQPISGSVSATISNASLPVTGDFYPATQPISGSVSISGTPTVSATISNASLPVTGDFYPETQPISGSVSISGTPNVSANISNTSLAVTGAFYPATQPISGTVSTTIDNATSSIQIYGSYGTNTKTAIKTDIDGKLEVVGEFSSVIDAATSSILMVGDDYSGADPAVQNPIFVDANGFITTNTTTSTHQDIIFGFDEMAPSLTTFNTGAWSKINPVSREENGWYTTNNGSTSSLLWYNNGPYGTQQSYDYQTEFAFNKLDLWFMIIKQYRPLTGSAGFPIMPKIRVFSKPTGSLDAITGVCHSFWDYTMTAGQAVNYGESIVIYSGQVNKIKLNNPEVRRVAYTNTGGSGDRGNNEIINHIEFIYEGVAFTFKTLVIEAGMFINQVGLINYYFSKVLPTPSSITNATGTITATVTGTVANINTSSALVCDSALYALNTDTGNVQPLTVNLNGNKNQLEVRDNDANTTLTSIDGKIAPKTTNNKTVGYTFDNVGLTTYQIIPKVKSFCMNGFNSSGSGRYLLAGFSSSILIGDYKFGVNNSRNHYLYIPSGSTARNIKYTYIDANGNEQTTGTATGVVGSYVSLGVMVGINEFSISGTNISSTTGDDVRIMLSNTPATNLNTHIIGQISTTDSTLGYFTCPNNAIAMVTSITGITFTNADVYYLNLWDSSGVRQIIWWSYQYTQLMNNYTAGGGDYACLGRIIKAGETVAITSGLTGVSRNVMCNIVVRYF